MFRESEKGRKELIRRYLRDRRGNVAIVFAVAAIPLVLMGGVAIDYAHDAMIRGRMTAVADAAALAATTPAMFAQDSSTAQAAAIQMFQAQAALVNGAIINYASPNCSTTSPGLCVTVTDTDAVDSKARVVTVAATVSVNNYFGGLENMKTTTFTISSAAQVQTAPNINFYMLLDNSPSMELPATTAGIKAMQTQTGCALACHEYKIPDSEYTVQYKGYNSIDSYTYAEQNNIPLRIDNLRNAAESIVPLANSLMDQHNSSAPPGQQITYQMSAHTFADSATQILALTPTTDANAQSPGPGQLSPMQIQISQIAPPIMASNNNLPAAPAVPQGQTCGQAVTAPPSPGAIGIYTFPISVSPGGTATYETVYLCSNTGYDDADTNFGNALATMNAFMPTPGTGTNNAGDSPRGVLLIVTDGLDDMTMLNSTSCNTSHGGSYSNNYGSFYRCLQPVNTSLCTTIKNQGILIAVLYTTYYVPTTDPWTTTNVAPIFNNNNQVANNLQGCASSPQLFAQVTTDGDITAALNQLFINAAGAAAHLTR